MISGKRAFFRITAFLLALAVLFGCLHLFFRPNRREWNNLSTTQGFYAQPQDTMETLFLGSSLTANGIIPTQLYEEHGLCAYNLSTEQQPLLASYYWLCEALRTQGGSLKNVVLEVSMLRRDPVDAAYHKALDPMQTNANKLQALWDHTGSLHGMLTWLEPIFSYHGRWKELSKYDFTKQNYIPQVYTRGYNFTLKQDLYREERGGDLYLPQPEVDAEAAPRALDADAVSYLLRIEELCRSRGMTLTLLKVPTANWDSGAHNAVQAIAEEHGLTFLDCNFDPLLEELDYNYALDSVDGIHANYYGAVKITAWLGKVLPEIIPVTDVRGRSSHSFLEAECAEFRENVLPAAALAQEADPGAYIARAMEIPDCMVFLSVCDDAANSLTQEQRDQFAALGLEDLAALTLRDSYLAVIQDGQILREKREEWNSTRSPMPTVNASLALTSQGLTPDGCTYTLSSGGANFGCISSLELDSVEYSPNRRGLNIIIYNYVQSRLIDSASFDTFLSPTRVAGAQTQLDAALEAGTPYQTLPEELQTLLVYNRRCENLRLTAAQELPENGLLEFLDYYSRDGLMIFLSVFDDASSALTEESRAALAKVGLTELSQLHFRMAYTGVIDSGKVIAELRTDGQQPLEWNGITCQVISATQTPGVASAVIADGVRYPAQGRGIFLAVYDRITGDVIAQGQYDTCGTPIYLGK